MATLRETLLATLATTLSNAGIARVSRSRVVALQRGDLPAVIVSPSGEDVQPYTLTSPMRILRSLNVKIEVHARGAIPDQAADSTAAAVHAALLADPTLGGRAISIDEAGTEFDLEDADQPAAMLVMNYRIDYTSSVSNLSN